MQLRSGKIKRSDFKTYNKHPQHNEIVFVIQSLINKVAQSDNPKEKIKYCTRIFNYLLQCKDFVNRYEHKRFYISI